MAYTLYSQAPPSHRGGGTYPATTNNIQAISVNWAWGAEPGTASVRYIGNTPTQIGSTVRLEVAGHTFWGVCKSDIPSESSSNGRTRTLEFADNRIYLNDDAIFAAFNINADIVTGSPATRKRRWKHILPENYATLTWTYTDTPMTAAEILDSIFDSDFVKDVWTRVYHADMATLPVFDLDFTNGTSARNAVNQVSAALGMTFTLMGGAFRLVWCRKGEGSLPRIPAGTDMRETGWTNSLNPTQVILTGSRNLYQIHNIKMGRDWKDAWQQFFDETIFIDYIYNHGRSKQAVTLSERTFPAGTKFIDIGSALIYEDDYDLVYVYYDPDQMVSRQMARARALEITVREFSALLTAEGLTPGGFAADTFLDYHKWCGRQRNDMHAVMYIRNILFRAFAFPTGFSVLNADGNSVPLTSLSVANKAIARINYGPADNPPMTWDATESQDGVGMCVIKGYNLGRDLFRQVRPERFNLAQWRSMQLLWEPSDFHVDDNGEGEIYIMLEEPCIKSADLIDETILRSSGYAVFKARPVFTAPNVMMSICFEAERFRYTKGSPGIDGIESAGTLHAEFCGNSGETDADNYDEVKFVDGASALDKAELLADCLLSRQEIYARGSFTRFPIPNGLGVYPTGTQLTPMIDSISLEFGPGGAKEVVNLTSELPRQFFTPESDLDRGEQIKTLLPGQRELRYDADYAKKLASVLRRSPEARKFAAWAFNTMLGKDYGDADLCYVLGKTNVSGGLRAGTPIWGKKINHTSQKTKNSWTPLPSETTTEHTHFWGATFREGEPAGTAGTELRVQAPVGDMIVRVMGPVNDGDTVGFSAGHDYLIKDGSPAVGRAKQDIAASAVNLIKVRCGESATAAGLDPSVTLRELDYCKEDGSRWKIKVYASEPYTS